MTPWTVARQAPLSLGFSRQEYWSGLPFPSPGNLLYPAIKPGSPAVQADSLLTKLQGSPNSYSVLKTQVKHPGPSPHHHPCPSYRGRSASSLLLHCALPRAWQGGIHLVSQSQLKCFFFSGAVFPKHTFSPWEPPVLSDFLHVSYGLPRKLSGKESAFQCGR